MTKMIEPDTLGGYLRTLRKRHGKSLKAMADYTGVGTSTLSEIETNHYVPNLAMAKVIANGYITTLEKMGKFV